MAVAAEKRPQKMNTGNTDTVCGKNGRPLRICMVTTFAKTFEQFVSDSAEHFADKGFEVTVVCGRATDSFKKKHSKFAKVVELPVRYGVGVRSVPGSVRVLSKLFAENKFDIIQYSTPFASLCCSMAKGFSDIPIRVYGQWQLRYLGYKGISRAFFKKIERFTCDKATKIVAVSPKNMEFAVSQGLCRKEVISVIGKGGAVGVDLEVFDNQKRDIYREKIRRKYKLKDEDFVFAFAGRISKDKGLNELLEAFREINRQYPKAKLFLVGREHSSDLPRRELLLWAKNSPSVIFTGEVEGKKVARIMAASDVFVLPSHREGFSMVVQEALAMELPVIATDTFGPNEIIKNGKWGSLFPVGDTKALIYEMGSLMNDKERRDTYKANGRVIVEKFYAREVRLNSIFSQYCRWLGVDDGHIKFMYLTPNPIAAVEAENAGVDRIFLDLEVIGKYERQGHLDTVMSHSGVEDVAKLKKVLSKAELLVRCNPVHDGLKEEIDTIISGGADMIMLPYFKSAEEVKTFLSAVNGRVRTVLLFETAESVSEVDRILELEGIDEVYIGLNDLHLSYKMKFMFELLSNGTVEMLCKKFRKKGIPYGFGGIAKIGEGLLRSDDVLAEHVRLGSTCAILSRTFRNEVDASRPIDDLRGEITLLRRREAEALRWDDCQFEENKQRVAKAVDTILSLKK